MFEKSIKKYETYLSTCDYISQKMIIKILASLPALVNALSKHKIIDFYEKVNKFGLTDNYNKIVDQFNGLIKYAPDE